METVASGYLAQSWSTTSHTQRGVRRVNWKRPSRPTSQDGALSVAVRIGVIMMDMAADPWREWCVVQRVNIVRPVDL